MDILAAQVSAMLYLAVVSWLSIHFNVVSQPVRRRAGSRAHFFHLETLEFNHFHVQGAGTEGYGLFPYRRKSAGQVAVDTLWEAMRSMSV
jgi:hypothetical protein